MLCAAGELGCAATLPNPLLAPQPARASAVVRGSVVAPLSPVTAVAAPATLAGEIGSAHPLLVRAAAADGGWTVVCQAREDTSADGVIEVSVGPRGRLEGDRLESFLVEGSGEGEPISAFVAGDPSGRYLAFTRDSRLILKDSFEQVEVDLSELGALIGTDESPFAPHRAASFSADGHRVLYLRRHLQRESVVVRTLESGEEVEIDPGEGLLWRAELDESGTWVVMRIVDGDTNGDGRWDWPHGKPDRDESPCTSPIPEYRAPVVPNDKPSVRVAPAAGGQVRRVRGYVTGFGAGAFVRRPDDRALFIERPGAPSELWSPSLCDGRLLHADPARGLLLVACATEEGPRALELVGRDERKPLGVSVAPFELDGIAPGRPRLVPVYPYPGLPTALVDLETRELISLAPRDRVIGTHGQLVLLRREGELYLGDPRRPLQLVGAAPPLSRIWRQAQMIFVAPWVIDMAEGKVLGRLEVEAMALSRRGAVLAALDPGDGTRLARGPLAWLHADAEHDSRQARDGSVPGGQSGR